MWFKGKENCIFICIKNWWDYNFFWREYSFSFNTLFIWKICWGWIFDIWWKSFKNNFSKIIQTCFAKLVNFLYLYWNFSKSKIFFHKKKIINSFYHLIIMVKAIKKFAKQFSSHKNQKQFKFYTMFRISTSKIRSWWIITWKLIFSIFLLEKPIFSIFSHFPCIKYSFIFRWKYLNKVATLRILTLDQSNWKCKKTRSILKFILEIFHLSAEYLNGFLFGTMLVAVLSLDNSFAWGTPLAILDNLFSY